MAAKIEIYRSRSRIGFKYGWRCRAANGQIVATGHQSFASKSNTKRAARNAAHLMADCWVYDTVIDMEKPR